MTSELFISGEMLDHKGFILESCHNCIFDLLYLAFITVWLVGQNNGTRIFLIVFLGKELKNYS